MQLDTTPDERSADGPVRYVLRTIEAYTMPEHSPGARRVRNLDEYFERTIKITIRNHFVKKHCFREIGAGWPRAERILVAYATGIRMAT